MKIYLLRHGETAYNVDHRYQGVTDIPLSPTGLAALKQADFFAQNRLCHAVKAHKTDSGDFVSDCRVYPRKRPQRDEFRRI